MGLKCGIVGLPNVGKSTLFNALSSAGAEAANFPFCTIEPNVGMVAVPDPRLTALAALVKPEKITPAFVEIVDIAGLVRGASEGKGRGNAFLSHIREVDLILHVVRCFEDENVVHVEGGSDPVRDIKIIEDELVLKDLESVEKREQRLANMAKSGDKAIRAELGSVTSLREHLEAGGLAKSCAHEDAPRLSRELFLLTSKPVLYVCNVSEDLLTTQEDNDEVERVREYARAEGEDVLTVCAKIEAEIAELEEGEKSQFLSGMGLPESGLNLIVRTAFARLGLMTFFTAGPKEVRAWTIEQGTLAPQAAGVIHTDFERGFIRAEVIKYEDYMELGSESAARDAGKMRSEGKEYEVEDRDVILFRFNV